MLKTRFLQMEKLSMMKPKRKVIIKGKHGEKDVHEALHFMSILIKIK